MKIELLGSQLKFHLDLLLFEFLYEHFAIWGEFQLFSSLNDCHSSDPPSPILMEVDSPKGSYLPPPICSFTCTQLLNEL